MDREADNPQKDSRAFPRLGHEEIQRIARFGESTRLPCGSVIFKRGERSVDFFVVRKGFVEIFDDGASDERGRPRVVHVHHERGFTGELDLFSDRKILVNGRLMTEDGSDGEVLRVPRGAFARMLSAEPDVGETVMRAFILRRLDLIETSAGGVLLVGCRDSPELLRLQRFLRRNGYPLKALRVDVPDEEAQARQVLDEHGKTEDDLPLVVCSREHVLCKPDASAVADCLGFTEEPDPEVVYDVAVVGAGPAGMAAAVYAASEGLKTLILESEAPGGQAGTSSRIENYLGFPTGLSGTELAGRGQAQAQKFGATLSLPRSARRLTCPRGDDDRGAGYELELDHGPAVRTRTVVLACGARWRTLDVENCKYFEGRGIHYAATAVEADLCRDREVVVVGGGNSAGQAAVYLSRHAKRVHMLVRSGSLADSMSDYLLQRIEASDDIELHYQTQIIALAGDKWLERVTWSCQEDDDGNCSEHDIPHVFLMIGAIPNTDWLDGTLRLDERGFVCTGPGGRDDRPEDTEATQTTTGAPATGGCFADGSPHWPLDRPPHPYETSLPGVFAAGDLRAGSVKRVASAVGEGSVCVQDLHKVLAEQRQAAARTD